MENVYKKLEEEFSQNNYYHSGNSFNFLSGTIPVILSAPHSVRHFREGKIKVQDFYTGAIVKNLHSSTKCHAIYSTACETTDPNYDLESEYKTELLEYIKENNIMYCLDIHGMSSNNPKIVDIGTSPIDKDNLYSFKNDIVLFKQVYSVFDSAFPDKIGVNNMFKAGPRTITHFISENSDCKCLQFEINGLYRWPDNTENIEKMINVLKEIVELLGKQKVDV